MGCLAVVVLYLLEVLWAECCNCLRRSLIKATDGSCDPGDCLDGVVCGTVPHAGFAAAQDDKFVL
jgi:hypothetical protein